MDLNELAAGLRRMALIEHVERLVAESEEQAVNYGGFLRELREAPAAALEGAIALHEHNLELYWLLGDFLQGGAGAEGALWDSDRFRRRDVDDVINAAKAAIERFREDNDEPPKAA